MRYSFLVLMTLALFTSPAFAAPVKWEENGHYYDAIRENYIGSWEDARLDARRKSFKGTRGHLATVTSHEENEFITNRVVALPGYWIGGFQENSASDPSEGWQWVTDEKWSYANWEIGFPHDPHGTDDRLAIFPDQFNTHGNVWKDKDASYEKYIIEYPIPEPGTAALVVGGVMLLLRTRQRV